MAWFAVAVMTKYMGTATGLCYVTPVRVSGVFTQCRTGTLTELTIEEHKNLLEATVSILTRISKYSNS